MTNEMLHSNATHPLAGAPTRLLVAMEMSLNTWRLVMALEGGTRKRVKTVEAGNYLAVEQAVGEAKARFQLPAETPVVFCYEAGRDGFYPYRRLTAAGHEVWVIDSASIEVSRRRKQAKSDGIDGDKLAELMQRQARGEPKAVRIVRVPPPEVEDQRLLPREREILLQDVGRLRNQIEAILFAHGYREVPNTARALQPWVEARPDLPPHLRERLGREIARLALLETQCRTVEKALAQPVREARGAGTVAVVWSLGPVQK